MKLKYIFFLLILNNSFAQEVTFKGKVEYDMYLSIKNHIQYNSTLLFNENSSVFSYSENCDLEDEKKTKEEEGSVEINISKKDTTSYFVSIDKKNQLLYTTYFQLDREVEKYYTQETIPVFNWILSSETKKINDIVCNKAQVHFRGRNYIAWYALGIPVSFGPWKFNGLPGLILEVFDETKQIYFMLKSIKIPVSVKNSLLNKSYKVINMQEHLQRESEKRKNFERQLRAKMGANLKLAIKIEVNDIELNYDDIKD